MLKILIGFILMIPCFVSAQNSSRNNQKSKDFEYAVNYRSSQRAKEIRLQNYLESRTHWEDIRRERDNKRLKYMEKLSIKKLKGSSREYNRKIHYSLEENKMYTVPQDHAFYILNKGLKKGQKLVFYKNKEGEILKVAQVLSSNTVIIYFPDDKDDRKILIQEYIKAEPGSIISLVSESELAEQIVE